LDVADPGAERLKSVCITTVDSTVGLHRAHVSLF